jgi:hypothetical protein
MQKVALVVLTVVALALLGFVFLFLSKGQASPVGREDSAAAATRSGGPASDAELARLRAEVESLRKQVESQKKRAEAAEERLAGAGSDEVSGPAAAEAGKAAAKKGDWKTRRDSELEAKVKSIDWRKRVKGLVDYWKEVEKSRAEGRAPQMTPGMIDQLTRLQNDTVELARMLGLENDLSFKAFQNGLVAEAYMDAFLQELTGGTISEDQLAKLRLTDLYTPDDDSAYDPNRNLLEQWRELVEHNQAFGPQTLGILTQEQHGQVTSAVTPAFMLSVYASYSERTLPGGAGAAESVAAFWQKSFQIPAEQSEAVQAVAAEYVRRQAEIAAAVAAQYGGMKSREAEFDLLLKTLELQIAAEKKLSETLHLTPEQQKLFLKGSGSVIKLGP